MTCATSTPNCSAIFARNASRPAANASTVVSRLSVNVDATTQSQLPAASCEPSAHSGQLGVSARSARTTGERFGVGDAKSRTATYTAYPFPGLIDPLTFRDARAFTDAFTAPLKDTTAARPPGGVPATTAWASEGGAASAARTSANACAGSSTATSRLMIAGPTNLTRGAPRTNEGGVTSGTIAASSNETAAYEATPGSFGSSGSSPPA